MKKRWLLVAFLAISLCIGCVALLSEDTAARELAGGTCGDNLTWVLTSDGVLKISGEGAIPDYDPSSTDYEKIQPWISKQTKITEVIIEDGVTGIGEYTFSSHRNITKVTIPDSVTSIGKGAFQVCKKLSDVAIPYGVTSISDGLFYGCEKLSSVTIPDSVTHIGKHAFANYTYVESIHIPASVTSVAEGAFRDCYLGQVHITDLTAWCKIAFEDSASNPLHREKKLYLNGEPVTELIIPNGITEIGQYAFAGCQSITNVIVPEGVTGIGVGAFQNNDNLAQVTIPGSVSKIGANAFSSCDNVSKVHLSDLAAWCGIEFENQTSNPLSRAGRLFVNGKMVTDLIIPDGATRIGKYAFASVRYLLGVTIPEGVTVIDDYAFCNSTNLSRVDIPNSVTRIGAYAFQWCTGLWDITIPAGVSSIDEGAFSDCSFREVHINDLSAWCKIDFEDENSTPMKFGKKLLLNGELLTDLVIPDGITSIGKYAFRSCGNLVSVTIPDGVTGIGDWAFAGCGNIKSVRIPNGVTTIGRSAFAHCGLSEITIPNSVTSIGAHAFQACDSLTSVTFPDSVTSIGQYVFNECNSLSKVVLPKGLEIIPGFMFQNCTNLAVVVIPDSVHLIQSCAFTNCNNLWHVLYTGNQWQWSIITIVQYADNSCMNLQSATYHYNYDGSKEADAFYKAATCTVEGEKWMRCDLCGAKHSETIPKTESNHYNLIETSIDEKLHAWDCLCGYKDTRPHSWHHGTITKVATCVEEGESKNFCDQCGLVKISVIAAKGHNYQEVVTAPTCTEQGYTTHTCFECGDSYVDNYVDATGHVYGDWTQVKAPTTEETGLEERVCNCGDKQQNELPMLEPVPTEPQPTEPLPSETQTTIPSTQPTAPDQDDADTTGNSEKDSQNTIRNTGIVVAILVFGGFGIGGIAVLLVLKKK